MIFTGGSKIAEHGGLNEDDVHIALLVSFPGIAPQTVKAAVSNQQVAPTILKALGIDPSELQAVQRNRSSPAILVHRRRRRRQVVSVRSSLKPRGVP